MLNVNVIELHDRIEGWKTMREDLLKQADILTKNAQALSAKIASGKTAIDLIESLLKDEQGDNVALREPEQTQTSATAPVQTTKTYINPEIQVSRWARGELEDTIMIVLRRENDAMTSTEIMNAVMQNRGRKVIENSLYSCLQRLVSRKYISECRRNGRVAYKTAQNCAPHTRHA